MSRDAAAAVAVECEEILRDAGVNAAATAMVEPSPAMTILTVDELAALLRVERKTVYAAITRGDIPGVRRVGRSIRISRDAVLDWLRTAHVRAPHPRRIR
jgi:excisionase family DNA binding protein